MGPFCHCERVCVYYCDDTMLQIFNTTMIMLLEEKMSDTTLQTEIIPTTPEVKENVAMAIRRAAKNGNFVFFSLKCFLVLVFMQW